MPEVRIGSIVAAVEDDTPSLRLDEPGVIVRLDRDGVRDLLAFLRRNHLSPSNLRRSFRVPLALARRPSVILQGGIGEGDTFERGHLAGGGRAADGGDVQRPNGAGLSGGPVVVVSHGLRQRSLRAGPPAANGPEGAPGGALEPEILTAAEMREGGHE